VLFRSYFNPNIHPAEEYVRRRDAASTYAAARGVDFVELSYDPEVWQRAVASSASRAERCRACYRLRLREVARWAAANGYDAASTTLTVSPYQDCDVIGQEGSDAAAEAHLGYVTRDFRDRYPEATRRARAEGMYRQNYCGCAPSEIEAQRERAERKQARAQARDGKDSQTPSR